MTDEYKQGILQYLTGTLQEEQQPAGIIGYFDEQTSASNGLKTYLDTELGYTYTIIDMLQSQEYDNYILYGTRRLNGTDYGFLLIVDKNFTPITLIKTYESGTQLGAFRRLEIDEKNQIYGVDYFPETQQTRFIMLNNVFMTGIARLRQSYNITTDIGTMTDILLSKDYSSANYLIAGVKNSTFTVYQLTVNVGAENEWKHYVYSGGMQQNDPLDSIYSVWNNDVPNFKITAFNSNEFVIYSNDSGDTINASTMDIIDSDGGDLFNTGNLTSVIVDINTIYYGAHVLNTTQSEEGLYLYSVINGGKNLIGQYPLDGTTISDTNIGYHLSVLNGSLFYIETVPSGANYDIYTGIYKDGVADETGVLAEGVSFGSLEQFNIINNYNLYKFNYQLNDTLYSVKLLYNQNMNFIPHTTNYQNPGDFKPLTMSLYGNNKLLFNRNLYNVVTNGSITTSTLEVPFTMLNDETIDTETLLGNSSLNINESSEEIETNIYETLHINEINSLSMTNLDNGINNPIGASRLNNSLNVSQDYQNAKADKIRINYSDNTNEVREITTPTYNNGVVTYSFLIAVPKAIENIQIISNDESTIYQTINGTFVVGKYYTISQQVTI